MNPFWLPNLKSFLRYNLFCKTNTPRLLEICFVVNNLIINTRISIRWFVETNALLSNIRVKASLLRLNIHICPYKRERIYNYKYDNTIISHSTPFFVFLCNSNKHILNMWDSPTSTIKSGNSNHKSTDTRKRICKKARKAPKYVRG